MQRRGQRGPVAHPPRDSRPLVELAGAPVARLAIDTGPGEAQHSDELLRMLNEMADSIRPAVDHYVARARVRRRRTIR